MPSSTVVKVFIRELCSRRSAERKKEPDLVMDDLDKVIAYTRAGREDGVMQPVYLYHCAQICDVIKPGDTVVDLGCGPATQLCMVARLNPETHFIGVDLSDKMLEMALAHSKEQKLNNLEFRREDISQLTSFANQSIDAIISTVVLHHLPDLETLERTFSQIARVLKSGGGLYLVDFGHLKSEQSIHDFAYQYHDRQAELFTLDYLYSLQAAFWPEDFKEVYQQQLSTFGEFYKTFMIPYMMVIKSPKRRQEYNSDLIEHLHHIRHSMPTYHKKDINDLIRFFSLGGLNCNLPR